MNAQHTPGPWKTRRVSNYADPGHLIFWDDPSKGGVHSRRLDVHGNFTEADARLISAAPELLEVARGILVDDMLQYLPSEYIAKVRAAIAKAEERDL